MADHKFLVRRWFDEVWNQQSRSAVLQFMDASCLTKVEGVDAPLTRDAFLDYQAAFLSAVPDLRAEVMTVVAEADRAAVHWRARGTHTGPGLGIPPSGRAIDCSGMSYFRFENGRIVQGSDCWNRGEMIASLMQVRLEDLRGRIGLTARESQVALLMGERLTYVEIASQLRIRPNTARRHCERVMMKLGVSRRHDVATALGKVRATGLERHGADIVNPAAKS